MLSLKCCAQSRTCSACSRAISVPRWAPLAASARRSKSPRSKLKRKSNSWSFGSIGAAGSFGAPAPKDGNANTVASAAARMRVFIVCLSSGGSIEQPHGDRLAVGGIEHFRPHRLPPPVGGYGQSPVCEQGGREFGRDPGRAGLAGDGFEGAACEGGARARLRRG